MLELKLGSLTAKQSKFKLERDRLLEKYYASRRREEEEREREDKIQTNFMHVSIISLRLKLINLFVRNFEIQIKILSIFINFFYYSPLVFYNFAKTTIIFRIPSLI